MADKSQNNHSHPTRHPPEVKSDRPVSDLQSSEAILGQNTSHHGRSPLVAHYSGTTLAPGTERPRQAFHSGMSNGGPSLDQSVPNTLHSSPASGSKQVDRPNAQPVTEHTEQTHPAQQSNTTEGASGFTTAMATENVQSAKVQASDDDDMSFAEREAAMWEVYLATHNRFREDFDFAISERRRERGLPPEDDA